jgi:hypothetical protein
MKGATEEFILFMAGIFVILIILATVFGKGIVYNMLGGLAEVEPSNLEENLRTILTVASFSPGEYYAEIKIPNKNIISINETFFPSIYVQSKDQLKLSNTTPIAFFTNCEIAKSCTKTCGFIGDKCATYKDCCGVLDCKFGTCVSTKCSNGKLEPGEECELGNVSSTTPQFQCNDTIDNDNNTLIDKLDPACHNDGNAANIPSYNASLMEADKSCRNQCLVNCTCPIFHGVIPQCNDGIDNDNDGLTDEYDSGCHSDGNAVSYASYDKSRNSEDSTVKSQCSDGLDNDNDTKCDWNGCGSMTKDTYCLNAFNDTEFKIIGDVCQSDDECWLGRTRRLGLGYEQGLVCMNRVTFESIDQVLIIRKYYEGSVCKIKLYKG